MSDQRILVAMRIRPPLGQERYQPLCVRKANDDQSIIIKPEETAANMGETVSFQFDYVFDENDDQQAVYEESVQELIDHALSGFNATVFTYGQTGSGKTYTILGAVSPNATVNEGSGMFLRVFDDLFRYKAATMQRFNIVITLSALELYVDDITDLLCNKKKLKLRETPEETRPLGIKFVEVQSLSDVVKYFAIANSFRSVTATKMNDTSSRSHALFFIDLFQMRVEAREGVAASAPALCELIDENGIPTTNIIPGLVRSRIALVDLAGSERVKRSGVQGQAMVEAQAINKSLSTLGTVINAMYVQNPHIPFRESKLTKLLKTSFTDVASRLLLIGQVAPPTSSSSESMGTLRFCDRVKGLKAGKVFGFADQAEEERFLHSLRLNEELTAEMRILGVEYYYRAANLHALASIKSTSLVEETNLRIKTLTDGASNLLALKEKEELLEMERQAQVERDAEVEQFILHMNDQIEMYAQVTHAIKKEKKTLKKNVERYEKEMEEYVREAKRGKKLRLKQEECIRELQAQLKEGDEAEKLLTREFSSLNHLGPTEGTMDALPTEGVITPAMEVSTHNLIQSFFQHYTELANLYQLYVERMAATGRKRALVRRQKLISSSLVTEGTLLYDILFFLVERAVDIADGNASLQTKWNWNDVNGLSLQLLNAEQLYPPLLLIQQPMNNHTPLCNEQYHSRTFLSSDESDGENSHHTAETRRHHTKTRKGADTVEEDFSALREDDGDRENQTDGLRRSSRDSSLGPHRCSKSEWMSGELDNAKPLFASPEGPSVLHKKSNRKNNLISSNNKANDEFTVADEEDKRTLDQNSDAQALRCAASGNNIGATQKSEHSSDDKKGGKENKRNKRNSHHNRESHHEPELVQREDEDNHTSRTDDDNKGLAVASSKGEKEVDGYYIAKIYDSPTLVQHLFRFLRSGTVMLKHGRIGKPHRRIFWINFDKGDRELVWMEPNSRFLDRSAILIDDISYIQLGCFSKVFQRHPISMADPAFFLCFSIGLKKGLRTVDIVADTLPDYEAWVYGLSHLVGVDPCWGGKLNILSMPGCERLSYFESSLCESHFIEPMHYLNVRERVQKRAKHTLEVLESCQNDAKKAHSILKGIHPPAINEKGALYLRKGELRFECTDLKLDIFRVTQIWILFQQMHLVYDDDFVPATPFGITCRK